MSNDQPARRKKAATTPADAPAQPPADAAAATPEASPAPPPTRPLRPWRVLLHHDQHNDLPHIVETILTLTSLSEEDASMRALEAHAMGVALLLETHRERAELFQQQFASRNLVVTIEPAESS